jgi:hypothetical protein
MKRPRGVYDNTNLLLLSETKMEPSRDTLNAAARAINRLPDSSNDILSSTLSFGLCASRVPIALLRLIKTKAAFIARGILARCEMGKMVTGSSGE